MFFLGGGGGGAGVAKISNVFEHALFPDIFGGKQ